MRIVFMGTPEFAIASLCALQAAGHDIAGVFCQPDKPQGRKRILTSPPVKTAALEMGLPVFQPQTLKTPEGTQMVLDLAPELIVVAAYGKLLPKAVLQAPKHGCINVHGSLLPKYRGAAPIQRAVMHGEKQTGVTIMQMAEGMDTGDMLLKSVTDILPDETASELFERLADIGADALMQALARLETLTPEPQDEALATWAPPLEGADGQLDFSQEAQVVYNHFRGVTQNPGAFAVFGERRIKILEARLCGQSGAVGTLLAQKQLIVACQTGSLELLSVSPEGSKPQSGQAFINGQRLKIGDRLF